MTQLLILLVKEWVQLYTYKIYNNLTTSPSKIKDSYNKSVVGYVKRRHFNLIKRIINFVGDGKFFNCFEVYYESYKLVFQSKQINQLKHKNYHVKYMSDTDKVFSINLIDESKITLLETAAFSFLSKEFEIKNNAGEWAYIIDKEQKNKIARCKSPITSPFLVYFELLDENYKENELLFLGILHTYLYGG